MSQNKNNRPNFIRRLAGAELLESRCLLSVNPLDFGVVYYEGTRTESGSGIDSAADYIYVSFAGGADGTQLKSLTIDLAMYGLDARHAYVDLGPNNPAGVTGAYGFHPFEIFSSDGFSVTNYSITRENTLITIHFDSFTAGDLLIIKLDVDEMLDLSRGIRDAEVTGAEFALCSTISATFTAAHYENFTVTNSWFYDQYNLPSTIANLPNDAFTNSASVPYGQGEDQSVYTAGAMVHGVQIPLPATISGKVYEDVNYNFAYESSVDRMLANVQVILWKLNESTNQYQQVATTLTNNKGEYSFSVEPGTYRVTEITPQGYLDVSSFVGTINGVPTGTSIDPNNLSGIVILGGQDSIRNDFSEYVPAKISGKVYEDVNYNFAYESSVDRLLTNVQIILWKLNETTNQYQQVATTQTNSAGEYFFSVAPGTYRVTEVTPQGYLDVSSFVGTINGVPTGIVIDANNLSGIVILGGQDSIHNDFSEYVPGKISGHVFEDDNNNGVRDHGERGIRNVPIHIKNLGTGETFTTTTDENGYWEFTDLTPGTYCVTEATPDGYFDGRDHIGSLGGVQLEDSAALDKICNIVVFSGDVGTDYDFGELPPASVSGIVWVDMNKNGVYEPGELLLQNVKIELRDANGNVVRTTYTDQNGYYIFSGLAPGVYRIFEYQPEGYLNGGQIVGSKGGSNGGIDLIVGINLASGDDGVHYDFWEYKYAKISGYVFQDGDTLRLEKGSPFPDDLWDIYPGVRNNKSTAIKGVTLILADEDGNPLRDAAGNMITTVTDKDGYYCFENVAPGTYTILELQPEAYMDGIDTPGSLGGDAMGIGKDQLYNIFLDYGDEGLEYNFSEILVQWYDPEDPPPEDPPGPPPPPPPPPGKIYFGGGGGNLSPGYGYVPYLYGRSSMAMGGGAMSGDTGPTWHLSVINAGSPRVDGENIVGGTRWAKAIFDPNTWQGEAMRRIQAMLTEDGKLPMMLLVGLEGAIPLVADFNGDGKDELAVFYDGFWFIDINGKFEWDADGLWVQLGKAGDQPVVGDWDGDGKADIGIFGPAWKEDPHRLAHEPGLPATHNQLRRGYKNIPPDVEMGKIFRDMKRSSTGEMRRDVIDHVFQYGKNGDIAITGDWTGDGITKIGLFRDGQWILDTDGDGRLTSADKRFTFGQKGDIPVVGNWDGDGISRIGVYRDGRWELLHKNGEVEVAYKGAPGEFPLVGDFKGEGVPQLLTYKMVSPQELRNARTMMAAQDSGDSRR